MKAILAIDIDDSLIEDEEIIHVCNCANCGADIEYYVPIEKEEENESIQR